VTRRAGAEERQAEFGARLGFSFPVGLIERGTRESDLTYGMIPIALDAAYVLSSRVSLGALATYAPTIPKLCASTSECFASIGDDFSLILLTRLHPPAIGGRIRPDLELGVGYLWSRRTLDDSDVDSARTARGPAFRVALVPSVSLSRYFEFGLAVGTTLSIAGHVGLDAPGVLQERAPEHPGVHGQFDLSLRLGTWL